MAEDCKRKSIQEIKEEDEERYLEVMGLYDELISLAKQNRPKIVNNLVKSKENTREKYVNNIYGGISNSTNPFLNQSFLTGALKKLRTEINNLKMIIKEEQEEMKMEEEKARQAAKLWKDKIHEKADEEFSVLIKWLQEIYDDYLLVFNKVKFEIFTDKKFRRLNEYLYKYSNSHTNSMLKQYIYELDNYEKKGYANFHIKNMEIVIRDWYWLYDTINWVLKKEEQGDNIIVNPDEPIVFTDEELELESNIEYAEKFKDKTQYEAFKIVADLVKRLYTGLNIEGIAKKFNIEMRPL